MNLTFYHKLVKVLSINKIYILLDKMSILYVFKQLKVIPSLIMIMVYMSIKARTTKKVH